MDSKLRLKYNDLFLLYNEKGKYNDRIYTGNKLKHHHP
jgi:hypothetical protein